MNQQRIVEKKAPGRKGMPILIFNTVLILAAIGLLIWTIIQLANAGGGAAHVTLLVIASIYIVIIGPIVYCGIKILQPNEALVLTLFGKYYGTLKGEGIFFVNPFVTAFNPKVSNSFGVEVKKDVSTDEVSLSSATMSSKKLSLKSITLNNERQKINDKHGNPIIIGIVVIWRVVDTAKAVFNVDNYIEYLSTQCDSALRNIVRLYPYDSGNDNESEKTLRSSSQEISENIKTEIQNKAEIAGLEIQEARITHLSYSPEIAAVMLQRQQASAVIDAKQMIVDGAVGIVEMALTRLRESGVVDLDAERKAAMVNNLMVVLCGNKDAQPIINGGTIF